MRIKWAAGLASSNCAEAAAVVHPSMTSEATLTWLSDIELSHYLMGKSDLWAFLTRKVRFCPSPAMQEAFSWHPS